MAFLAKKPIEKAVMTVVKNRISSAEKAHADYCAEIESKTEADIEEIRKNLQNVKDAHVDVMVQSIVGVIVK